MSKPNGPGKQPRSDVPLIPFEASPWVPCCPVCRTARDNAMWPFHLTYVSPWQQGNTPYPELLGKLAVCCTRCGHQWAEPAGDFAAPADDEDLDESTDHDAESPETCLAAHRARHNGSYN